MIETAPPSRRTLFISLLLIALCLLGYFRALRGGFIWDDDDYVTENVNLRSLHGLREIWLTPRASPQYYPMVFTTFWVEYHLWGDRALGYHLDNVLLHALASILLWRALVVLEVRGALLAACLFAVHPVHVESVAWISERKNVLSGVFYFSSALAYLAWASRPSVGNTQPRRGERPSGTPTPRWALYVASLVLFVLALLSKTVTCSLPAALLLVSWWKHGGVSRREVVALMPFFAIGLVLAINTAGLEVTHVQAAGSEWDYSVIQRVLIAGRAVWFYATKLILPFALSFIYPKWTVDSSQAWQWALPIGAMIVLLVLWRMRGRWGRGPLVATLIFFGTLVPALGFFNVYPMRYTYVADHYQYHASAALLALIAAGLSRLGRGAYVLVPLLLLLCLLRAAVFNDAETLWRDTLAKNPNSWMVHLNLARTLLKSPDQREEAFRHFERQVQLAPQLPETHWNYGSSLLLRRRYEEALAAYDEAIRLGGANPLPQAYFGRGMVFMDLGDFASAAAEFQRAIELKPDYHAARQRFAEAMGRLRQSSPGAFPSTRP